VASGAGARQPDSFSDDHIEATTVAGIKGDVGATRGNTGEEPLRRA